MNHVFQPKDLAGHPIIGVSWEGYVIEEICRLLPDHIQPYYYRTHHGAEVDLILFKGIRPVASIEIKPGLTPVIRAGFYTAVNDLETKDNFVIYSGNDEFKKSKGVTIASLDNFLVKHLPRISK